ncbi:MAG: IMP dehydrogenase, partial [Leifsonia sp.]
MRFLGTLPAHDLTYSDVFLVPNRSAITSRLDVDLAPGDGSGASIPIVSANMNSVTGPRLAATLARRGGLGVLPQDLGIDETIEAIAWVKGQSTQWDAPHDGLPEIEAADPRSAFDGLVAGGHDRVAVTSGGQVVGSTTRTGALR